MNVTIVCLQPGSLDFNNQLLAPGGKGMWGSWGKGSSGGTGAKPASGEQGKDHSKESLSSRLLNGLNVNPSYFFSRSWSSNY